MKRDFIKDSQMIIYIRLAKYICIYMCIYEDVYMYMVYAWYMYMVYMYIHVYI